MFRSRLSCPSCRQMLCLLSFARFAACVWVLISSRALWCSVCECWWCYHMCMRSQGLCWEGLGWCMGRIPRCQSKENLGVVCFLWIWTTQLRRGCFSIGWTWLFSWFCCWLCWGFFCWFFTISDLVGLISRQVGLLATFGLWSLRVRNALIAVVAELCIHKLNDQRWRIRESMRHLWLLNWCIYI